MSDEYTPTPDEAFDATLYTWVDWKGTFESEDDARAAWGRMISEIERTAAEKALTDAIDQVNAKAKAYADTAIGLRMEKEWADSNRYSNYAAGLDMAANELHKAAEAYRREGKEQ